MTKTLVLVATLLALPAVVLADAVDERLEPGASGSRTGELEIGEWVAGTQHLRCHPPTEPRSRASVNAIGGGAGE